MHRQIAGRLTGPVSKWIVFVAVLVVTGAMSTLSSKLIDVQNNEASSWLPGSAESTKVVEELTGTVDPNDIPTLIVYHRDSGLTDDDLAAMDEQAQEIAEIDGVTDEGVISPECRCRAGGTGPAGAPLISEDGEVAYLALTFNFGENGWNDIPEAADEIRDIAQIDGVTVHLAGFGGQAADAAEAFEGIDTNLILITLARGDRDPALHLPQPDPVAPADHLGRRRLHDLRRRRLPPRQVRRPHRQRAESGDPRHPGDRRRHRLRPAARGPISRGAAPPRGPARGDGVRPAPGRPGDPGQRRDRRRRHAVPDLRRPQLHRRPRSGPRRRRRRHLPGDGDPAARRCW